MWLFTTFGFFSVVAHASKPDHLLVRARSLDDIARLRTRVTETWPTHPESKPDIFETIDADYPYRMTVLRTLFADAVADELRSMTATNFKHAVAEQDPARARLYTRVWWEMKAGMNPEQLDLFGEADENVAEA